MPAPVDQHSLQRPTDPLQDFVSWSKAILRRLNLCVTLGPLNQVVLVLEHANGGTLRDQMEGLMQEERLRESVARPLLHALSALQAQVRGLGQVEVNPGPGGGIASRA